MFLPSLPSSSLSFLPPVFLLIPTSLYSCNAIAVKLGLIIMYYLYILLDIVSLIRCSGVGHHVVTEQRLGCCMFIIKYTLQAPRWVRHIVIKQR